MTLQPSSATGPIRTTSRITCPACGAVSSHDMPTDACRIVLACPACEARLTPLSGDCCVFCSYGDVPCPPIQEQRRDGRDGAARCCAPTAGPSDAPSDAPAEASTKAGP